MSLIQGTGGGLGGSGAPGGALAGGDVFSHTISQSLKLDDSSGGHLTISSASPTATNRKKVTISCWVKRSTIGTEVNTVFWASTAGLMLQFFADNTIYIYDNNAGGWQSTVTSGGRLFRDPTAWYHLALIIDTTKDITPERAKFYINGERQTLNSYPGADTNITWHTGSTMKIGNPNDTTDLAGYIAEFISIDGQDVLISDLGETVGGVWTPKDVSGLTLGDAGFYLKFNNSSDIGNDSGSNNIDFTASNLVAADVVSDSPTNSFCTLNPLTHGTYPTLKEGNLSIATVYSSDLCGVASTWFPTTGKWYWEVHNENAASTYPYLGITDQRQVLTNTTKGSFYSVAWLRTGASQAMTGTNTYMGTITKENATSWTNNDIIMFALDVDARKLWIGKNGTWEDSGNPAAGTGENASWTVDTGVSPSFMGYSGQGVDCVFNFGQDGTFNGNQTAQGNSDGNGVGDFYYSPPSGFLAMATSNIDTTIGPGQDTQADDYFETMLYTGNGDEQHIGANGVQHPVDTVTIGQSLRFEDNHHLDRTATAGNQSTWTFSAWIKRAELGTTQYIWTPYYGGDGANESAFRFTTDDKINIYDSGASRGQVTTTREFKDVSSWMHLVVVLDLTDSTAADRIKIYVNGELQNKTINNAIGTSVWGWNANGNAHRLGGYARNTTENLVGYMAEVNFVDGTALDPTYFGQVGANGYWIPKTISGLTYGANGFRMTFQNSSYLNYDYQTSDRSTENDFDTPTGLAATDLVTDSPTQNFTVLDSNYKNTQTQTFAAGNLDFSSSQTGTNPAAVSTFAVNTGKWYWEVLIRADAGSTSIGIASKPNVLQTDPYALYVDDDAYQYMTDGTLRNGSYTASYGDAWTTGDIVGVALDLDAGTVKFYKNGTVQNSGTPAFTGLSSTEGFTSYGLAYQNGAHTYNFGQDDGFSGNKTGGAAAADANSVGAFYYTPPSDHLALMNDNIPKAGIESPDFVWAKGRSLVTVHNLHDTIRGTTLLQSNATDGEQDNSNYLLGYGNQGFTIGDNNNINKAGDTYVAWTWKAGGISPTKTYKVHVEDDGGQNKYRFRNSADDATFATYAPTLSLQEGGTYVFDWSHSTAQGHPIRFSTTSDGTHNSGSEYTTGVVKNDPAYKTTITVPHGAPTLYYYCQNHSGMGGQVNTTSTHGSTNFDGSLQSIVTANQTAGFSIVAYDASGVSSGTVGHGLTVAPDIIIAKPRDKDGTNWFVQVPDVLANTHMLNLETTGAAYNPGYNHFNDTVPTTSVFSFGGYLGGHADLGSNTLKIAYCFHSVEGYSKVAAYRGNGNANGTFVYTGFRPAWLMLKKTSGTGSWNIADSKRSTGNEVNEQLQPNLTNAESTTFDFDFLSNGFKARTTDSARNTDGATYMYLAFAEAPFKFANAR